MISAASLLSWSDRNDARRRAGARGLAALPHWVLGLLAGGLVAVEIARRLGVIGSAYPSADSASTLWLVIVTLASVAVLFGAPFRLYWRSDSALLARLAVPGSALFRLGLVRSVRAAGVVLLFGIAGSVPMLAADGGAMLLGRHMLVLLALTVGAGLGGPAVALAAGAIVASGRAQAVIDSFGGEFKAPPTTWLGALPALAGTGIALVAIVTSSFAVKGASGPLPFVVLGGVIGASVACALLALREADTSMLHAIREISALDQERLAHVERSTPSLAERLWFALTLSDMARVVATKDASLSRRRYPSPYFLFAVGIVALWIVAGTHPDSEQVWTGSILAGLSGYSIIMARRLATAPVELPRLLRTLPVSRSQGLNAKRSQVVLRGVSFAVLGGLPNWMLADKPWLTGSLLVSSVVVAIVGGWIALRAPDAI